MRRRRLPQRELQGRRAHKGKLSLTLSPKPPPPLPPPARVFKVKHCKKVQSPPSLPPLVPQYSVYCVRVTPNTLGRITQVKTYQTQQVLSMIETGSHLALLPASPDKLFVDCLTWLPTVSWGERYVHCILDCMCMYDLVFASMGCVCVHACVRAYVHT